MTRLNRIFRVEIAIHLDRDLSVVEIGCRDDQIAGRGLDLRDLLQLLFDPSDLIEQ